MSLAALPYSVFLLLTEFSVGAQLFLFAADLRGEVTRGFVKMGTALVCVASALTLWMALAITPASSVAGYALAARYLTPSRLGLAALLLFSIGYTITSWLGHRRRLAQVLGWLTSLAALGSLAAISAIVQQPTWSYAGTFLSLLAGGLALGGVTLAMSLGHWYLVTPRLPEEPLNQMTVAVLAILGLQIVLLVVNLIAPLRQLPDGVGVPLARNPAFWLRVGVGLVLPIVLSFMAWQSSRMRGMMSATGLLYLATGAVLAGEALACALLFTTAIPG